MGKSDKKTVIIIVSVIASVVFFFVVAVVCAFLFSAKISKKTNGDVTKEKQQKNEKSDTLKSDVTKEPENVCEYVVNYKTEWPAANIHYRFGDEEWTEVPGIPMEKASEEGYFTITLTSDKEQQLEVCFNDGHDNWDSQNAENYILPTSGSYVVTTGAAVQGTIEEAKEKFKVDENGIVIYYFSRWQNPHVKYCKEDFDVSDDIGTPMEKTDIPCVFTCTIPASEVDTVYVRFNDGKKDDLFSSWDKNKFEGYPLKKGSYTVYEGIIKPGNLEDARARFDLSIHNEATVYFHAPSDWKRCYMSYNVGLALDYQLRKTATFVQVDAEQNIYKGTVDLGMSETFIAEFSDTTVLSMNFEDYKPYNLTCGVTRIKDGVVTKE
ncbi:MAG: hypothetical protein K6G26_02675 [Lachnospiraceae bacterium]|nr:hypothetical protein [Lachnospiraceae bacterium]